MLFDGRELQTLRMIEKGLDASSVRRSVIANNVANVDVPNFKRSSVGFESQLKRAVEMRQKEEERGGEVLYNNDRHIRFFQPPSMDDVKPVVHTDYRSSMRNDGNNVDMEEEITDLARNQMQYSLMVERLGGTFRLWNNLIRMA